MLKVYTQENTFTNRKKPYVFKSQNDITVDEDTIIRQIADANTTITEADARAVMNVLERVFWNNIRDGNVVKLFMGSFRAGAAGSAETSKEIFKPVPVNYKNAPQRDHKISLLFKSDIKKEKLLCEDVKYERITNHGICNPYISSISGYSNRINGVFSPMEIATIDGKFIKIDCKDDNQGVFISGKGKTYKPNIFIKNTRTILSFQLPAEIEEGEYLVTVKTNRRGLLHESNTYKIIIEKS